MIYLKLSFKCNKYYQKIFYVCNYSKKVMYI